MTSFFASSEESDTFRVHCFQTFKVPRLTSPSSSSTSRKSKSLKTLNCCSEVVSSILSGSRVPSSEDTRLGWCSMRSSSPQLENITYTQKQVAIKEINLTGYFWIQEIETENWNWLRCYYEMYLTEGFFVSPTSCPHKDKTFTNFSRVLFCKRAKENKNILNKIWMSQQFSLI